MATFRPSARLTLQMRFDEGASSDLDDRVRSRAPESGGPATPPAATTQELEANLADIQATLLGLTRQRDQFDEEQYAFFREDLMRQRDDLQRQIASGGAPDAVSAPPPDGRVVFGTIIPRDVQIERNGVRTADTCTIELDFRDAPFDPRTIRSAAVDLLVGIVPAADFEDGIRGGRRRSDGSSISLLERRPDGSGGAFVQRFLGVVDKWTVDYDDGDSTITLDCRDFTAFVIDQQLDRGDGVDLTLSLDEGIRQLLNRYVATRGISVLFGEENERGSAPTPSAAIPAVARARRGQRARRARRGDQRMTVWDHITDVCAQTGFVPCFFGTDLRILRPRTFYAGRSRARRMIYGRNLSKLSFTRQIGGIKTPTIEVRCFDQAIGRTRWARYPAPEGSRSGIFGQTSPPRPGRAVTAPPGGEPDDSIQTFTVSGVTDASLLEETAESIWEQIGRQEIEGSFETADVSSWDQPPEEADLLGVQSGDAVEVLVASPLTSRVQANLTATTFEQLSREARVGYLRAIGWSEEVATRFAQLQDTTPAQSVFRVQNARVRWNADDGIKINVDFINFLVVRDERQARSPEGPSPETDARTGSGSTSSAEARRLSAVRRLLTTYRDIGLLDEANYSARMDELSRAERDRLREVEDDG